MKYLLDLNWYQSLLLGALSGILLTLAHPPFDLFPEAWVAMVPLLLVIISQDVRKTIWATFGFGLTFFSFYLSWVTSFGPEAYPALVLAVIVIFYVPAALLARYFSKRFFYLSPVLVALTFVVMEYLRTVGFIRFPYGILAYSQWNFTALIQIADLLGYLGVSLLLYLSNAMVADFLLVYVLAKNKKNFITSKWSFVLNRFVVLFLLWSVVLGYGFYKLSLAPIKVEKTVKVSLVQYWFDNNKPWNLENKALVFDKLAQLSLRARMSEPDLIVWPETAVLDYYELYLAKGLSYPSTFYQFFKTYGAQNTNTWFLTGTLGVDEMFINREKIIKEEKNTTGSKSAKGTKTSAAGDSSEVRYYNQAILVAPNATVTQRYSKHLLVAFAEWFPYGKLFPWVNHLLQSFQASQFTPGDEMTLFKHPKFGFATLICYEDCFAEFCRQMVLGGADGLVVITNDAWSYSVKSEMIHFIFSVFRAVENRRPVLRASNAGITAHIDAYGHVVSQLSPFREDELNTKVDLSSVKSFYTRYGTVYVYGLMGLLAVFFIYSFFVKRISSLTLPRWLLWIKTI